MPKNLDYIETSLQSLAIPIDQIRSDPDNARQHSSRNIEIIKTSLATFGQQKPIVIDGNGICLAGNGTLQAAIALGWSHIAAARTSLSGPSARAFGIADNRATDTSQWHQKVLAEQLANLQNNEDFSHIATGFTDTEIDQWIGEVFDINEQHLPPEVQVSDAYHVLVMCNDEADQRSFYERLTEDGFKCRLLTL